MKEIASQMAGGIDFGIQSLPRDYPYNLGHVTLLPQAQVLIWKEVKYYQQHRLCSSSWQTLLKCSQGASHIGIRNSIKNRIGSQSLGTYTLVEQENKKADK